MSKKIISDLQKVIVQNETTKLEEEACKELIDKIKEYKHKEKLCYCCNKQQKSKNELNIFKIEGRRYGSMFDGDNIEIHLCNKCKKKIESEWFTEKPTLIDKYFEKYKHEGKIKKFIDNFTPENQEYIYSTDKKQLNNNEVKNIFLEMKNIDLNKEIDGCKDFANNDEYAKELAKEENNLYLNMYNNAYKQALNH